MPKFTVELTLLREASIEKTVEAETEDEASEIVWGMWEQGEFDDIESEWWDYDCRIEGAYCEDGDSEEIQGMLLEAELEV